jgi:hypothetical protein
MGWLMFFASMVGFVALGFFFDRMLIGLMQWNEDRKIHKILADEVVRKYQLEKERRHGEY